MWIWFLMFSVNAWKNICHQRANSVVPVSVYHQTLLYWTSLHCNLLDVFWSTVVFVPINHCNEMKQMWWGRQTLGSLIKQGERQQQQRRLKTVIWFAEWGKTIVLHLRHPLRHNPWCSLPNDNMKFPILRF